MKVKFPSSSSPIKVWGESSWSTAPGPQWCRKFGKYPQSTQVFSPYRPGINSLFFFFSWRMEKTQFSSQFFFWLSAKQYLQPAKVFEKSFTNPDLFFQFVAIWLIYNSFKGNWAPHLLSIKPHLLLNWRKTIPAVWLLLTRHHVPAEILEVLNFAESILIALTELRTVATNSLCIMMRVCYTHAEQHYFQSNLCQAGIG